MGLGALPIILYSLCWANTIGAVIRTLLIAEALQIQQIRKILLLVLRMRPSLPKDVASAPRFAYKRRAQCSANNISCVLHIVPVLLALSHSFRFTYCSRTLPINWAVLIRNGNKLETRWRLT